MIQRRLGTCRPHLKETAGGRDGKKEMYLQARQEKTKRKVKSDDPTSYLYSRED